MSSSKNIIIINQIMQILESTYFGKFYYEVAMILRDSLFLSSILLNSEAWVNYKENDIRILEQCDELLLSRILDCDGKTSNTMKYLELGAIPIRFLIMKRKILFLQYISKQDKKSMIYNVLKAIQNEPMKNDFVTTCKKYIETLKMNITFEEMEKISKFQLRRILVEQIKNEALVYLKNSKQPDISRKNNVEKAQEKKTVKRWNNMKKFGTPSERVFGKFVKHISPSARKS